MVTDIFRVTRVSHVQKLCEKKKISRQDFVRDVAYLTRLSRPTLEKAYNGSTDLDLDVIEKLAWFFEVDTSEVIESKF